MSECANCQGQRIQDGKCLECGLETAEFQQTLETATKKSAPRKATVERRG